MPNGVRRLNRRRYQLSVNALQQIIGDPKTPPLRKLRAIDTLLGIYDRHDRSEAAKTRRKAEDAPEPDGQVEPFSGVPERPRETAEEFLARIAKLRATNAEQEEQEEDDNEDE